MKIKIRIKGECERVNLYRGAKKNGLKVMEPNIVNHGTPYVYATTDKIEAIIYSVKGGNFNYTNIYGYDDDGKRCLIERKKNCLEDIYNTVGRYYVLDDKIFEKHEGLGVGDNEYVSILPVKVIEEVKIDNVWQYFKELEQSDKLKIYRYPSRPKLYPDDDSDLIECAIIMYLQGTDLDASFNLLLKYHPELSDIATKKKNEIIIMSKDEIRNDLKYFK